MNDCTAWATTAAKSCLEAMDQGWSPNQPATMFSPAFIYPQINHGTDDGSSVIDAALLMQKVGAATLKTTPYIPLDYKTQPSDFAFEEAGRYRIQEAYILETPELLKLVLQENIPIVVCARLTPNFFDGRFASYTKEMHLQGMKRRQPDQPHSKHAMVLVGYDEPSQRYLLRNSWGEDWGQGGYCWVDFDVIDEINASRDSESFLFLAVAMEDKLEVVEATPEVGETIKDLISIKVRGEADGFDVDKVMNNYRVTAELRAPEDALALISQVKWILPPWIGEQTLTTSNADNRFRIVTVVGGEVNTLTAQVRFRDGSTRDYSFATAFTPPDAAQRPVTLTSDDFYAGTEFDESSRTMRDSWTRVIRIDCSGKDLRELRVLELDDGSGEEPETMYYSGNLSELGNFYGHAFEVAPIVAKLTFLDGSQKILRHEIDAFADPADDGIWMNHELHPVGDGKQSAFTLTVRAPVNESISHVMYELDGSQKHYSYKKVISEWRSYPISGMADRDFRARATVHFFSERAPVVLEEWIELPDNNTAYAGPQRVDLWHHSSYLGKSSSQVPRWGFSLRLSGDWEATKGIQQAEFSFVNAYGEEQTVKAEKDPHGDWLAYASSVPQELAVKVRVQHQAGDFQFERLIKSPKPAIDHLYAETQTYFLWPRGDQHDIRYQARLNGGGWVGAVQGVAYVYQPYLDAIPGPNRDDYWSQLLQPRLWQTMFGNADRSMDYAGLITRVAPQAGPLIARAYLQDGMMEVLPASIQEEVGEWSGPGQSRFVVRLQERFMGIRAKKPFRATFWLDASEEDMATVDYLLLKLKKTSWAKATKLEPTEEAVAYFDCPGELTLRVVLKDGSFEDSTHAMTGLPERVHQVQLVRFPAAITLEGPGFEIESIKEVTYQVTPKGGETQVLKGNRYLYGFGVHATVWEDPNPADVVATLDWKDGTTTQLSATLTVAERKDEPELFIRDSFWGYYEGKPQWLLDYRHWNAFGQPDNDIINMHYGGASLPSPSSPDFEVLTVRSMVSDFWRSFEYRNGDWIEGISTPITLQAPEMEEKFVVTLWTTWVNPSEEADAKDEYLFKIEAPIKLLDEVVAVEYKVYDVADKDNPALTWLEYNRFSLFGDGFRGLHYSANIHKIETMIYFHDQRPGVSLVTTVEN